MNFRPIALVALCLLLNLTGSAHSAATPEACSIAVGITTRTGTFRTWTNALETMKFAEKGLTVCQDDAILNLSDDALESMTEEKAAALLKCNAEFKLELLFYSHSKKDPSRELTRNVTIFKNGKAIFSKDYLPNPSSLGSLKILKTLPTCAELQKLAAPSVPAGN